MQIEQIKNQNKRALSKKLDYLNIETLSKEAREALNATRPETFGEAAQLPGVSKADLTALLVWLKVQTHKKEFISNLTLEKENLVFCQCIGRINHYKET